MNNVSTKHQATFYYSLKSAKIAIDSSLHFIEDEIGSLSLLIEAPLLQFAKLDLPRKRYVSSKSFFIAVHKALPKEARNYLLATYDSSDNLTTISVREPLFLVWSRDPLTGFDPGQLYGKGTYLVGAPVETEISPQFHYLIYNRKISPESRVKSVVKNEGSFHLHETQILSLRELRVPFGHYSIGEEFLRIFLETLPEEAREYIDGSFESELEKISLTIRDPLIIAWPKNRTSISQLLGYQAELLYEGKYLADFRFNVNQSINSVNVCTDIVENQIHGNKLMPVLQSVSVSGPRDVVHRYYYSNPAFHPVNRDSIREIKIELKNDQGEIVPLQRGKVVVVLEFRENGN
jgi:hypothetical protein